MPPAARKRPFYVVLALLGALALGTSAASSGCMVVEMYRAPIDASTAGREVADEADRAAIVARFEGYLKALDAGRSREWPIAVGTLVLGVAILAATFRALGGSKGARTALVQLVMAQAALGAASYALTRDVVDAETRLHEAENAAKVHQSFPQDEEREYRGEVLRMSGKMLRVWPRIELALGTLCSTLVVLALTRRRAREFFETSPEAYGER